MDIKTVPIDSIKPYEKNAKKHPDEQVEQIANSLKEFGWQQPLVIDKDNIVVIGHGRLLAARHLGMKEVPVVCADGLTDEQIKALRLADNKLNESPWDDGLLSDELDNIFDIDMSLFGFDDFTEQETETDAERSTLADRFLVPPFSILRGDSGVFTSRKKAWLSKGIKSEIGRGGDLCFNSPDEWQDSHR